MRFCRFVFWICLVGALMISGCGGGGEKISSPPHVIADDYTERKSTGNQILLGPLSGSKIRAFRLTDMDSPVEGPIIANESLDDLEKAGSFSLELAGISEDEWILVTATGGQDIDADDDGELDPSPTPMQGTLHALAKASEWRSGNINITALSEIAWRYAQDVLAQPEELNKRLDQVANLVFFREDLDGDGGIGRRDIGRFHPRLHRMKLVFPYAALLPDLDQTSNTFIESLHRGDGSLELDQVLHDRFGPRPWEPAHLETLQLAEVDLKIPQNREGITAAELTVKSFLDDAGQIGSQPIVTDMGGPNVVMAQDYQGESLLLGYAVPPSAEEATLEIMGSSKTASLMGITSVQNLEVSPRSTALALIMVNGAFIGTLGEERAAIAAEIVSLSGFAQLEADILDTFQADPHFLAHLSLYPNIVEASASLALEGINAYIESLQVQTAHIAIPKISARLASMLNNPIQGEEKDSFYNGPWGDAIWIWHRDEKDQFWEAPFLAWNGMEFAAGNPEYVNYSAEFFDEKGTFLGWTMVGRNSSLVQKAINSGAAKTLLDMMPSDAFHVEFNKYGLTTLLEGWTEEPEDQPAVALHITDMTIGMFSIVDLLVSGASKIANKAVTKVVTKPALLKQLATSISQLMVSTEGLASSIGAARGASSSDGSALDSAKKFLTGNLGSFVETSALTLLDIAVSSGALDGVAQSFTKNAAKTAAAKWTNPAGWALIALNAVDSALPFWGSYLFADQKHGYRIEIDGASATVERNDKRPNQDPALQKPQTLFTASYVSPLTYRFDASETTDNSAQEDLEFVWVFSDWHEANGVTTEHTFGSEGFYDIQLTVVDPDGNQGTFEMSLEVLNGKPPIVDFINYSVDATDPLRVTLKASVSDEDQDIKELRWYKDAWGLNLGSDADLITQVQTTEITFVYENEFVYAPVLVVVDNAGNQSPPKTIIVATGGASYISEVSPKLGGNSGGYIVTLTGQNLDQIGSAEVILGEERAPVKLSVAEDRTSATFEMPEFTGTGEADLSYYVNTSINPDLLKLRQVVYANAFGLFPGEGSEFVDVGDGTIIDPKTGLMWLKDADCFGQMNAIRAANVISNFNSDPGIYECKDYAASYNDWYMPTKEDWLSIVDSRFRNPVLPYDHPFYDVNNGEYWSSTAHNPKTVFKWAIRLSDGYGDFDRGDDYIKHFVWPVRNFQKDINVLTKRSSPVDISLSKDATRSLVLVTYPEYGEVSLNGTIATYTPFLGYVGNDSFTFRGDDGVFDQLETTVNIEITDPGYVKLDEVGNVLPDNATEWSCVRQENTGLVWEVKSRDQGLQYFKNSYSWFDGSWGYENGGSCSMSNCDIFSYVESLDNEKLCGFYGWRVPSYVELGSLLLGRESPLIDKDFFPYTVSNIYMTKNRSGGDMFVVNFRYNEGVYGQQQTYTLPASSYRGYVRLVNDGFPN